MIMIIMMMIGGIILMMLIMLMMIFVLGQWHWALRLHLNRIEIISETLMEKHLMKMT